MSKKPNKKVPGKGGSGGPKGKKGPVPSYKRGPFSWILILPLLLMVTWWLGQMTSNNINWNTFEEYLKNGQVESVEVGATQITGVLKGSTDDGKKDSRGFTVDYKQAVV